MNQQGTTYSSVIVIVCKTGNLAETNFTKRAGKGGVMNCVVFSPSADLKQPRIVDDHSLDVTLNHMRQRPEPEGRKSSVLLWYVQL